MIIGLRFMYCKMLGYNLFSQYIRCFCGFKPLFNMFSPGPLQTGSDLFFAVFCSPSPRFFGSKNLWDWSGPWSVRKMAQDRDQTGPLSTISTYELIC